MKRQDLISDESNKRPLALASTLVGGLLRLLPHLPNLVDRDNHAFVGTTGQQPYSKQGTHTDMSCGDGHPQARGNNDQK